VLSCAGIGCAAQPFLAALLHYLFPHRPIVLVLEGLKAQELAQQDLATWLSLRSEIRNPKSEIRSAKSEVRRQKSEDRGQRTEDRGQGSEGGSKEAELKSAIGNALPQPETRNVQPLFYPAWEVLPGDARLPHADVISERLETLVALTQPATRNLDDASRLTGHVPLIVTSVAALLQRTFPRQDLRDRTRVVTRGDRLDPLDLVEWLEEQGYEAEAQATQKGEMALRGGILDLFPLTSPWPVRVEFFGDEVESLRYFDPLTQMSREEIAAITIPPAGELGLLKRMRRAEGGGRSGNPKPEVRGLGTLLDYLPADSIFLLCEPEQLAERADEYAGQVPEGDPFFIPWGTFQEQAGERGMTRVGVSEAEPGLVALGDDEEGETSSDGPFPLTPRERTPRPSDALCAPEPQGKGGPLTPALSPSEGERENRRQVSGEPRFMGRENASPGGEVPGASGVPHAALGTPHFESLEAFRPLAERAPEPQVAEAQRREFFAQLHRWLRQSYAVHVFCNNDGERQRFAEIWEEYGLAAVGQASSPDDNSSTAAADATTQEGEKDSKARTPGQIDALCAPEPQDKSGPLTPALSPSEGERGNRRQLFGEPRFMGRENRRQLSGEPRFMGRWDAGPTLHLGTLARGFLCDEAKLVVVTDAEIFGRYKVQRSRRLKSPHAQATRSALDIDFTELEEGDYVVHLQHGIGRYVGLQVLPIGAGTKPTEGLGPNANSGQECLVVEYAPGDPTQQPPKLYVPVTEAHLVSKYVGTGKAHPPLNTLGGTRWARAKEQAERAVRDVASDLLAIQAARDSQPGHAFAADAPWQREFEGAFIFEETPDQERAIVETKSDMERAKPMDRLICGDVGFGKTEVGIRAAFKAVMDGKQVAVLVPTTVLAQQHYNTFGERMADYPIRLELLSRFRTRRAQERVVADLAAGAVDIVIGTHRLLQDDIAFKDLGLVVIDEEQRFGVMHKEKFKMLRRLVDVLTLSATPIPRTLYLALTGARDMSTIQTPPHDRLPVETIVIPYDERVIRDAIQREINRGGQVFFLHNRVMTIETMAERLRGLLPQARIVVGHGQMHSDDLEEVMTRFVNGGADVLLSTTIIESGLDIPNANTIIIDRADRFGLSDLYQLRGRVGRYKHQAYAYLLLPRHGGLLTDVRKRLSAIKQYSTLGSGFKIAMRDLEIRGAGNLLGSEQSGHITAVGFELYCQLLKQSVASLKGEKVKPRVEVELRLDFLALSPGEEPKSEIRSPKSEARERKSESSVQHPASAYIPFRYISDARQRIEIYRKLAQATDPPALRSLERELRDRFGPLPPALKLLVQVVELKTLASERGVTAIEVKEDKLMLTRNHDYLMVGGKFPRLTSQAAGARLQEIKKLLMAL
jgi:transcription-repair coupling factor